MLKRELCSPRNKKNGEGKQKLEKSRKWEHLTLCYTSRTWVQVFHTELISFPVFAFVYTRSILHPYFWRCLVLPYPLPHYLLIFIHMYGFTQDGTKCWKGSRNPPSWDGHRSSGKLEQACSKCKFSNILIFYARTHRHCMSLSTAT